MNTEGTEISDVRRQEAGTGLWPIPRGHRRLIDVIWKGLQVLRRHRLVPEGLWSGLNLTRTEVTERARDCVSTDAEPGFPASLTKKKSIPSDLKKVALFPDSVNRDTSTSMQ